MPDSTQAPKTVRSLRYLKGTKVTGAKYLSQIAKRARRTTPTTSIAIMYGVCHLFRVVAAIVRGRSSKQKPPTTRSKPTTDDIVRICKSNSYVFTYHQILAHSGKQPEEASCHWLCEVERDPFSLPCSCCIERQPRRGLQRPG